MQIGRRLSEGADRLRTRRRRQSEDRVRERFTQQLAQQWAQQRAEMRAERRAAERRAAERVVPTVGAGPSNFTRAQVPWAVDLAAAWSWRVLVIAAGGVAIGWVVARFSVIVLPLVIAMLVAALAAPLVDLAARLGINRKVASILVVLGGLAVVVVLLGFVGQQIAQGISSLADQVVTGLDEIQDWLRTGPLHATDSQINDAIQQAQDVVVSSNEQLVSRITEVGTAVGHIVAGFFIVLFASYFFLADGSLIWAWVVRLFPRAARTRTDSSGRVAWRSVTQFVRATVLVAFVDAVGVVLVALILKVPLASAIGVLVFLGAFIPLVGALLSGSVAVLVALVSHGPIVALLMLAGVVLVQQVEAHVLQPFLLGRFVSVHPLGVIVAIACGVLVAGVAGALVAVPLVAAVNAVAQHLAGYTEIGEEPDTDSSAAAGESPPSEG